MKADVSPAAAPRWRAWAGSELARFAVVGVAAAVVDASALALAIHVLGFGPYAGRVFSYLVAATFAWACNRRFTFTTADKGGLVWQWLRYLGSGAMAGLLNFGVYSLVVLAGQALALPPAVQLVVPYVGVAVGSLASLTVSFVLARRVVFRVHRR